MASQSDRQLMMYLLLGALVVIAVATYAMIGIKTHERSGTLDAADLAPLDALLQSATTTPATVPLTPTSTTSTPR